VASGRVFTFDDFPAPVFAYSPLSVFYRMAWFAGRETAWFLRLDRYCKEAELVRLDLVEGAARSVVREQADSGYLEFHQSLLGTPNVRTVADSSEVVWWSERDGWGHLYLYDADTGTLKHQITCGKWLVRDIVNLDERERRLLFTACGVDPDADPARRSLCSIKLDGSGFEVLLAHDGDVAVPKTEPAGLGQDRFFRPSYAKPGVSPTGRFAVGRYSSVERGNVTQIVDLRTRRDFAIASALPAVGGVPPRPFTALAADGVTKLHGVLFFPSDFDERRRYPLIDYIYPGPQFAWQPQSFGSSWTALASTLAELGFVTLMLDTRGMPFRNRALHQIGYGELLEPQLADHAAVVRQLCERYPFLDGDRVGMIGMSGGGLATARALFDYGAIFKVGVAVCGNHDSSNYSTIWSDKYRGPGDRESWVEQANHAAAHKLSGKLLLISGDMDENVHVSQTLSLVDALIRANRDFDLLIVPNQGHHVLMTSGYAQRRAWDYFVRHLLGTTPPPHFEITFEPHELARREVNWLRELSQ
jgi:dipeptidyl-peptidase 4